MEFLKRPIVLFSILIVLVFVATFVFIGKKSTLSTVENESVATLNKKQTVIIVNPGGGANDAIFKGFEEVLRTTYPGDPANLTVITKNAGGDQVKLKALISEAVSEKPDLISTASGDPMVQALEETKISKIPIVAILGDPAVHGYIPSLQNSGTNLTGIAHTSIELTPKRFEILKQVFSGSKKVAVFYDTTCGVTRSVRPQEIESASKLGFEVTEFPLINPNRDQIIEALKKVTRKDFDSIIFYPHLSMAINADLFLAKARDEKLAIIIPDEFGLKKGAIASYGPDFYSAGKQMARLAIKVLGGENPQNIPFEQSLDVKFAISTLNTKALGITVSDDVLFRADLVVTE